MVAVSEKHFHKSRKPMFSQQWYRVEDLKPRLVQHVYISRQEFRSQEWFILRHHLEGRFHRIPRSAYAVVQLMDGRTTMNDIWKSVCLAMPEQAPTQDDIIELLGRLYQQNLINSDTMPDIAELQSRFSKQRSSRWQQQLKNPMAIRIPLWNPERFLERTRWLSKIFSPAGLLLWTMLLVYLLMNASIHWNELTQNFADRLLAKDNLILMAVIYPFIKLLHEMAHAYAVKRWRGQVNEMGLMFLVFIPVPYVNASASTTFASKYRRMVVSLAGIMMELAIAAVAMWIWLHTSDPLIHSLAFNALVITGVSTLLFNGNPLLRFDGYYALADFLELPNLYQRSQQYFSYLVGRYVFRLKDAVFHAQAAERRWFLFYAVAAWFYRLFISFGIALFVAQKFFIIGFILALVTLYGLLLKPLVNQLKKLFTQSKYYGQRGRILTIAALLSALLAFVVLLLPVPYRTVIQGVTWAPEQSHVRAQTEGWFEQLITPPGIEVKTGQPLIQLQNRDIKVDRDDYKAKVKVLEARLQRARSRDRSEGQIIEQELNHNRSVLHRLNERLDKLLITSPVDGQWLVIKAQQLPGRYIQRGELLGYVLKPGDLTVLAVADQAQINAIRSKVTAIDIRPVSDLTQSWQAQFKRLVPEATKRVPHPALSRNGGGPIDIDPGLNQQEKNPTYAPSMQAFENLFQLEFESQQPLPLRLGERVYIRISHPDEPLFYRWWRDLRRVFLAELDM